MTIHWAEQYVGRACGVEAGFDCVDLAALIQKEVFGHDVRLPVYREYSGHSGISKFHRMSDELAMRKGDYVEPTSTPSEGDVALIKTKGYLQHVGVFCRINNEAWILHVADGSKQVILQKVLSLPIRGMFIEGYYKWK